MPKISICTICLNAEKEIYSTINSIIKQTYTDYELIIKDGISKDKTLEIIYEIAKKNPDVSIRVISQKDSGIYNAMNQAISFAQGDYCIFINSGDAFYDCNSIMSILPYLNNNNEIIYGDSVVKYGSHYAIWSANISIIKEQMPFCHQACLIKTALLKRYQFDENFKIAADYDLILRLFIDGHKFVGIHTNISIFSLDGLSSTNYTYRLSERYKVRCKNGLISNDYKSTDIFRKQMIKEKVKQLIDRFLPYMLTERLKHYYINKKYNKFDL